MPYFYSLGPWRWQVYETHPYSVGAWFPPSSTVGLVDLAKVEDYAQPGADRGLGLFVTTEALDSAYTLLGEGDIRELQSTGRMRGMWESLTGYRPQGATMLEHLREVLTMGGDPSGQGRWKPLMPTIHPALEIHLGGHGLLHREPFQWGTHAHTPQVQTVIHRDWQDRVAAVERGEMTLDAARRALGGLQRQFGVQDWHEFVPPTLRGGLHGPLAPQTTIQDNFNRGNSSTLGTSSDAQFTWNEYDAGLKIEGNLVSTDSSDPGAAQAQFDFASDGHYAQALCKQNGANGSPFSSVMVRHRVSPLDYYEGRVNYNSNFTFTLRKTVGGSDTQLATVTESNTLDLLTYIESAGSTIVMKYNGVTKHTVTDTAITGHLRTGIRTWTFFSIVGQVDNFGAVDIAPPPTNAGSFFPFF